MKPVPLNLDELQQPSRGRWNGQALPNWSNEGLTTLQQHEAVAAVRAALSELSRNYREALQACTRTHPDGLTCRQLARRLGVSATTVSNWAADGRRRLQLTSKLRDLL